MPNKKAKGWWLSGQLYSFTPPPGSNIYGYVLSVCVCDSVCCLKGGPKKPRTGKVGSFLILRMR